MGEGGINIVWMTSWGWGTGDVVRGVFCLGGLVVGDRVVGYLL